MEKRSFWLSVWGLWKAHSLIITGSSVIPAAQNPRTLDASLMRHWAWRHRSTIWSNARLHQIGLIRNYLTKGVAATLVHAEITSRLDNFNAVLIGLSDKLLDKLQMIQNNAGRMVTRTKSGEHIASVLKRLHWLPVCCGIQYKIILLCFKALNNIAPMYLSELLEYKEPSRYNLRQRNELLNQKQS